MYRIFLSFKYLTSRVIPFLAMFSVALGVMSMIVVISVMNGFIVQTRAIARGTLADLTVSPRILNAKDYYLETIHGTPKVKAVSSHLVRQGIISTRLSGLGDATNQQDLTFVTILGVDYESEKKASAIESYLTNFEEEERFLYEVDDVSSPFDLSIDSEDFRAQRYIRDGKLVIIGYQLALRLGIRKGTYVDLVSYSINPKKDISLQERLSPRHDKFICAGVFHSGDYEFDLSFVYMPIDRLRDFALAGEGEVSEFAVTLEDYRYSQSVKAELQERFQIEEGSKTAWVQTWEDKEHIFLNAVDNEKSILAVILSFFLAFGCFAIFIILNMMVREKTRDIGILNSMGATFGGILIIFVLNAMIIAFIGSAVGLLGGVLICDNINAIEQWLEDTFGLVIFRPDVYAFDRLPVDMRTHEVVYIITGTILLSAAAGLVPAFRAARLDPVRALRYE
ncbi:MAG: ABC transporter permease [Planctomycetota bacterium]